MKLMCVLPPSLVLVLAAGGAAMPVEFPRASVAPSIRDGSFPTPTEEPQGSQTDLRVSIAPGDAVVFGPAGCPVAVVGAEVYDLKTGKSQRRLSGLPDDQSLRSLSADGKFLAAASKPPNQKDTAVTVWSTETGRRVLDVPGDKNAYVDLIILAQNRYLLLVPRPS